MTDDIEELKRMLNVLTDKLRYFKANNDENRIMNIEKNIEIISERIIELTKD